jgi:hypothetical protein
VGRRVVARGGPRGGERIQATRQSRRRLTAAVLTIALCVAIVVYAVAAGDRLPQVVAVVGAAGCVLTAVGLARKWSSVLPVGLAGVGAAYGAFLGLRGGAVDTRAPAVAAALFLAAELGFAPVVTRFVVLRLMGAAVGAALIGSLLLVAATGAGGSVALEAAGVAAAVLTLAAIALLASRPSV